MKKIAIITVSVVVMGAVASPSGCVTTSSTDIAAQCAAWRAITYSVKKDTPPTVKQIRIHNQVGRNLGCWK